MTINTILLISNLLFILIWVWTMRNLQKMHMHNRRIQRQLKLYAAQYNEERKAHRLTKEEYRKLISKCCIEQLGGN